MRTRRIGTAAWTAEAGWAARRRAAGKERARLAGQGAAAAKAPASGALAHLAAETLELGCLYERHGAAHIRVPIHLRQQDGPCEWHTHRVGGRLARITYTCERLEDWVALAERDPEAIPRLYRGLLGRDDIAAADLFWPADVFARAPAGDFVIAFRRGTYNPLNVWNTLRGAVHVTRRAAGRTGEGATLRPFLRRPDGPITAPGGRDVADELLQVTRRDADGGSALRIEVAPPPGASYGLDDLTLPDGERLTACGLVAHLVRPRPKPGWEDARMERDGGGAAIPDRPFAPRTLPGGLVATAMLQLAGLAPVESWSGARGWRAGHA